MDQEGEVRWNSLLPGETALIFSSLLGPTPVETRRSLLHIRREGRLSRAQLAAALGVGKDTLRRWETGERKPCAAARKLVRLVEGIFFSKNFLSGGFGGVICAKVDWEALAVVKKELLPENLAVFVEEAKRRCAAAKSSAVAEPADNGPKPPECEVHDQSTEHQEATL